MKHSNYQVKINKVKHLEYEELKRAVVAHGGSYEWDLKGNNGYPIIAINANKSHPEPQDVKIKRVAIVDGYLKICGVDMNENLPVYFTTDDIFTGHLSFVTDYIPATDEISDVSLPLPTVTYKPNVGDKVWLFNRVRRDNTNSCYGEVIRIGRKFFYVKVGHRPEERFELDTLRHNNGNWRSNYELHNSQEACEYSHKAIRCRHAIGSRLYNLLTDEEAVELYDKLAERDK